MKSVETLLVNVSVCPLTAELIVEYSPAKEQVEICTIDPPGSIVAEPKDDVNVHWLQTVCPAKKKKEKSNR